MSLKDELIAVLPPFKNDWQLIKKRQDTDDIISEVQDAHQLFEADYDLIYKFFDTGDIYDTCKKLWEFQRYELTYKAESGKDQSSRNPSSILQLPDDCKHYALFTSGVLSAIQRHKPVKWQWFYRFASDTEIDFVTHVFVIVVDRGREIWIDPCLSRFDSRRTYLITQDEMALYRITGINDIAADPQKTVVVDKQVAFKSFLTMLGQDMFALKRLLRSTPAVTYGPVRQYFLNQGFDWNDVVLFMNTPD